MIWGYKLRRRWFLPRLVQDHLGDEFIVHYHSKSFDLDTLYKSLPKDLIEKEPDHIVIQFLNDQMFIDIVQDTPQYEDKLHKCLDLINGCRTYLMTPVAPTASSISNPQHEPEVSKTALDALDRHYSIITKVALDRGIGIVDLRNALADEDPIVVYQDDGYHLTDVGQQIAAKEIVKNIKLQ